MTSAGPLDALFQPFALGKLQLGNRLVMAPMTRRYSPGGVPGEDVAAYYRRRAEGGTGLIITEGTWIPHRAASNEPEAPRFYGEDALAGWKRVVDEVHAAGGKIFPQLWHVGLIRKPTVEFLTYKEQDDPLKKVSPSGYVLPGEKLGEGMADDEVEAVISAYAEAARSAKDLGFDGVEIHGAHGYLIDQFIWHETNHRTDRWGGPSPRDRVAFAVAVVRACRAAVGPDFPISFRFSQWKMQDYGARLATTPEGLEQVLGPLADAGVDVFHASTRRYWEPAFEGSDLNLAAWAKKLTGKPSITVGSVGLDQTFQESFASADDAPMASLDGVMKGLERGDYDLVAVGRLLLHDPHWGRKIRDGDLESLRPFNRDSMRSLT